MKYYKDSSFSKSVTHTGLYTIIACCLLALGAATWFAVSRYNKPAKDNDELQSTPQYSQESVDSTPAPTQEPAAAKDVPSVPYTEQSAPEPTSEPAEEKQSFILPVEGNVSKGYSENALQYSATFGDMRLHNGIDIVCEAGTEIRAAGSGTVKAVRQDAAFGKVITIDHGDGITADYCGIDAVYVKEGDTLHGGDTIGTVGDIPCECADQSHLHISAAKDEKSISPLAVFGLE